MARADDTELIDKFEEFYRSYYRNEMGELAEQYPDEQKSLYIDWLDLYRFDSDLAEDYRNKPGQLREYAEEALRLYDLPVDVSLGQAHVRVHGLPEQIQISEIRADHRGRLLAIPGKIEKTTDVRPKITTAAFECQRCGTLTRIPQDGSNFQEPHECQGCERKGPFHINENQSEFIDSQKISLEEPQIGLKSGDVDTIEVSLEDDITGSVSLGDQVVVSGVLRLEQGGSERNPSARFGAHLDAQTLEIVDSHNLSTITDEETEKFVELSEEPNLFERLEQSIGPTAPGLSKEKLALVLQLFGGVQKEYEDGTSDRGSIHTLFITDPGTFVERVIESAIECSPHAVEVDGSETSATGLATTGIRSKSSTNDDGWDIGIGPLIEADQGHAFINGIDDLGSDAESSLETVLNRQAVDASKATAAQTFDARASVVALGNPKYGRFDQYEPIGEQITVRPDSISSFDLIFICTDIPDRDEDTEFVEHTLKTAYYGQAEVQNKEGRNSAGDTNDLEDIGDDVTPAIDPDFMRNYIAYAREHCFPALTEEARERIEDYYIEVRSQGYEEDAPVPVSRQKIESLIRLAEASARARLSDSITVEDVERVTDLISYTLKDIGLDPATGELDGDVVETGTSKSQRDRANSVLNLIVDIESKYDEGAPVDIIIERLEESGMDRDTAEHEVDKLKEKGEVYEPWTDHLRTT